MPHGGYVLSAWYGQLQDISSISDSDLFPSLDISLSHNLHGAFRGTDDMSGICSTAVINEREDREESPGPKLSHVAAVGSEDAQGPRDVGLRELLQSTSRPQECDHSLE